MRPTDDMLDELAFIEMELKALEKRAKEIKDLCRAQGSFSTDRYVVLVSIVNQTRLEGIEAMTKFFGRDALAEAGLIKSVSFETVKIQQKRVVDLQSNA